MMYIHNGVLLIVLLFVMWIHNTFNLWLLYKEVKKGNKDQQEIKTRLAWVKKRQLKK